MKKWVLLLIIFGIVFLISISVIAYLIFTKVVGPLSLSLDYPPEDAANNPRCSAINLEIIGVNATTKKMTVKRNVGGEDFPKLKIYYEGYKAVSNVGVSQLKEGTSVEVSAGYTLGHSKVLPENANVLIAPILSDGTLCDLKDSAIAYP